jgi:hypothetical protein
VTTTITITGQNFISSGPDGSPQVFLDEFRLPNVQMISSTRLRATVPPLSPGTYDVRVVNPAGQGGALPRALTLQDHKYLPLVLRTH